jgi:Mg-chelatase subunit ChlD
MKDGTIGNFIGNQILDWTPLSFSVEFIKRMRSKGDKLLEIPSTRQAVAIPKLLIATYYRKSTLIPEDYIRSAVITTPIEDQRIAREVAMEILFPPQMKPTEVNNASAGNPSTADLLASADSFMNDLLNDIGNSGIDINNFNSTDLLDQTLKQMDSTMNFIDQICKQAAQNQEPANSVLHFMRNRGGYSDLINKNINNVPKVLDYIKSEIQKDANNLSPSEIQSAIKMGLANDVLNNTHSPWVKAATQFGQKSPDFTQTLENIMQNQDVGTAAKTMNYLTEMGLNPQVSQQLTANIIQNAKNLMDINELSNILNHIPSFNQQAIFQNSLEKDMSAAFKASRQLDEKFNSQITSQLFKQWLDQNPSLNISNLFQAENNSSLWQQALKEAVNKELSSLTQQEYSSITDISSFARQLQDLGSQSSVSSCETAFKTLAGQVGLQALKKASNLEFIPTLKDLINSEIKLSQNSAIDIGQMKQVPLDSIIEVFGGNFELLKKMFQQNVTNYARYDRIIQKMERLGYGQVEDLMKIGCQNHNIPGLASLGLYDMGMSFDISERLGPQVTQMVAQSLTAGPGENLLLQWFIHKHKIPKSVYNFIRNLTKNALIQIAMNLVSNSRGSGQKGIIPSSRLRSFLDGDEMDSVDIDATIENIILSGKTVDQIQSHDLIVTDTQKGRIGMCFLLDISGSMSGRKLAACAIAVTMLIAKLKSEEIAIAFFESNTHVMKNFDDQKDIDEIADELLDLKSMGGTKISRALEWSIEQLNVITPEMKICFLLTDCEFSEKFHQIKWYFDQYPAIRTKLILAVNHEHYNREIGSEILKSSAGEFIRILNIPDIPYIIAETLEKIG